MKKLILTLMLCLWALPAWGADLTCCASGCDGTVTDLNAETAPFDDLDGDTITFTDATITNSANEAVIIPGTGGSSEGSKTIIDLNGNTIDGQITLGAWTETPASSGNYTQTVTRLVSGFYEDSIHLERSTIGVQDGGDDQAILTDSGESWTVDAFIGDYIYNITDDSSGEITDNDGTTVTANLAGGTDNNWDDGDEAVIMDNNWRYDFSNTILIYKPTSGTPASHTLNACGYNGVNVIGMNFVEVKNGTIKYTNEGVDMTTSGGNHDLTDLDFQYLGGNALDLDDQASGDVDVTNCTVLWAANGFYYHDTTGDGNTVTNCTVSYVNYNDSFGGDGLGVGAQRCEVDVEGGSISYFQRGVEYWATLSTDPATGTVNGVHISNSVTGSAVASVVGAGIGFSNGGDNALQGIVISNCIIRDCRRGVYAVKDCNTSPNKVLNCTFYNNDEGTNLNSSADYYEFKNNIFLDNTIIHDWHSGTQNGTNNVADDNRYYPDGATRFYYRSATPSDNFADWQSDSSQDANSFVADPGFIKTGTDARGFTPKNPDMRKGATGGSIPTTDYFGVNYDGIGAVNDTRKLTILED